MLTKRKAATRKRNHCDCITLSIIDERGRLSPVIDRHSLRAPQPARRAIYESAPTPERVRCYHIGVGYVAAADGADVDDWC